MGEGEGGMIWENGIETCILSCVKRIDSPGSMHDTGCSGLLFSFYLLNEIRGWDYVVHAGCFNYVQKFILKDMLKFVQLFHNYFANGK